MFRSTPEILEYPVTKRCAYKTLQTAPENMGRRNLRLDVLAVAASIAFGRLGCFARESSLADLLVRVIVLDH